MISDLLSLFFPNNCAACDTPLLKNETTICIKCQYELPYTRFHDDPNNQVNKLFWGKTPIESATSLLFFQKDTRIQTLLHLLKYKGRTQVGERLGLWLGHELAETERFSAVDAIIPVPLHPKKQRSRGYNQAQHIALGLADALDLPVVDNALVRSKFSETQTRKSKFKRWENVESIFDLKQPERLENKHILLVDDVVTTGSTLEACAQRLSSIEGCKVSIATLACA
jgi:competence protein ComFC